MVHIKEHINTPLVSICIPTFNGATFIADAIESALAQTYPNIEIVVSDDASVDGTLSIVAKFQKTTTIPLRVFHHTPNGIGANWNYCVQQANGDYIKFLFQDDVLQPICVEKMVLIFEKSNEIGIVASKRDFIIDKGADTPEMIEWRKVYGDLQTHLALDNKSKELVFTKKLFGHPEFYSSPRNKIGEPSVFMFKKNVINKVGWFREDLKQLLDYEFCYRVLKAYNIVILQEQLVKFRLHNGQATQRNKEGADYDYWVYDKVLYDSYFWSLHYKTKWKLFKRHHAIPKLYREIKMLPHPYGRIKKFIKKISRLE